MRKLLLGMTALAALAFAVPDAAMAQQHRGGGSHVSGGGGAHFSGGGRAMGGASFNSRSSFSANRNFSRNVNFNRNFNRNVNVNRNINRNVNISRNRFASSDFRHHHRHHRRHFRDNVFFDVVIGDGYDYAAYDSCYQYIWTRYGYRYVNVCAPDYPYYYY
jgi:hypothetical protein